MLPATLLVPAIRPLVIDHYGGTESHAHAFMAVNMLGAVLLVPIVGRRIDRLGRSARLFAGLAVAEAMLLSLLILPLSPLAALVVRFLEGAAHVGAATVLIAVFSRRAGGSVGRTLGMAGAAIIAAVVLGSLIGGRLVAWDVRAPLCLSVALAITALVVARGTLGSAAMPYREKRTSYLAMLVDRPGLWLPLGLAFLARFTIGCTVVTFALFAHRVHGLSDAQIGGLFALLTFPFALAMYPAARATDVAGTGAMLAGGAGLYALCLGGIPHVSAVYLPVLMVGAGLASAAIFGGILAHSTHLTDPQERGRVMALINSCGCLGMLLGPVVAGVVCAAYAKGGDMVGGYRAVFSLAGGAVFLWLCLATPALVRGRAQPSPRASESL